MQDLLLGAYPWIKTIHIISVISWMAGLFYLPRLFVHHVEKVTIGSETDDLFQMMERKLLKVIMNPAMIASWVFGFLLALTPGIVEWSSLWPWMKLLGIIGMTAFHMWLAGRRKEFTSNSNKRSGRTYRIMNEVPTVLMILIVVSVIVRPFS